MHPSEKKKLTSIPKSSKTICKESKQSKSQGIVKHQLFKRQL